MRQFDVFLYIERLPMETVLAALAQLYGSSDTTVRPGLDAQVEVHCHCSDLTEH